MRTIDRVINKIKTAQMGGVRRLVLAIASAMVMWHGAAMGGNAGAASSSAEVTSATEVQSIRAPKQVAAIYQNPNNDGYISYYWSDGTYSDWSTSRKEFVKDSGEPVRPLVSQGWPAGKQVAAIAQSPLDENNINYFWSDGGYSDWSKTQGKFVCHDDGTGPGTQWFRDRGWPAGKRVAAIYQNPNVPDYISYYWSDGGYSDWSKIQNRFVFHDDGTGQGTQWFASRDWPAGKRVAAIYQYPNHEDEITYFWSDGSYSIWDEKMERFLAHGGIAGQGLDWFASKDWPTIPALTPSRYVVEDVRVNQHSTGNGAIYANGRMQYRVVVQVKIIDLEDKSKNKKKGVAFSDLRTGVNQAGQLRDLVTLYRRDRQVDTAGANLAIDGVGDYASGSWRASRTDSGYDKLLNVWAHYSEQIDGTVVENDQDDVAIAQERDVWNTYIYWVSSTEQTGADPMHICARVGSYSSESDSGEGYYDSCGQGRDDSAKVRVLPPKQYGPSDYEVVKTHIRDGDYAWHHEYSVGLKGNRIASAQSAPDSIIAINNGLPCVATYSTSWNALLGQFWNRNSALYMTPFGSTRTEGPNVYQLWHDNHIPVPRDRLNPQRINFISTTGKLSTVTHKQGGGTWSACLPLWTREANHPGAVEFIDSYGNAGVMRFRPAGEEHLEYAVY